MWKYPILVQFEYHPASHEAIAVAEMLHSALNDDSTIPGLRIPTRFVCTDCTSQVSESIINDEADNVFVVLLADDYLVAEKDSLHHEGCTWSDYVVELRDQCSKSAHAQLMPVQLSQSAYPIDPRFSDLNFLSAWSIPDQNHRNTLITERVVHQLIQKFAANSDNDCPLPFTIFISHTKLEVESEPYVVQSLIEYLTLKQPVKAWFDSGNILAGSVFANDIERGVRDSALLIVATDSYSSRSWCRREVLLAKKYLRPVVVVNALQSHDARSFPYLGNVPVIRWKSSSALDNLRQDNARNAVNLLLKEALRHLYTEKMLAKFKEPEEQILPYGPELITQTYQDTPRAVLYPDPPLGHEELLLLEKVGMRVITPLQRFTQTHRPIGNESVIALSISESEDIEQYGLRKFHLDEVQLEICRYLLLAGYRLAYGGDLRPQGYTLKLIDLLHDPSFEYLYNTGQSTVKSKRQLVLFLPWPTKLTIQDKARLAQYAETIRCSRPHGIDENLDARFVTEPESQVIVDSSTSRLGWSKGLSEMRVRQSQECFARIALGGKKGGSSSPYSGRIPGVLEEVLQSIQAKQPVYLIGAFGGCTKMIIDIIEGTTRSEMSWEYQRHVPFSEELREMYQHRKEQWVEYAEIVSTLKSGGFNALNNGLNISQNRLLASTRSADCMIELLLTGLSSLKNT